MSSSQQSFTTTTTTHASQTSTASTFSLASFPSLSQETSSTLADPNSPELFKQNIQVAMEQVARVNALARSTLNGIQNAYQAGVNPAQTQADLVALDQAMHALAEVLRQSGVGAYPLPAPDARHAGPPTEQELIADTTRGVQQLYEELKRMQESSAVVTNLLAAPENLGRPKA
ncbi:hypothetical protein OG21DRAFT_1409850 [Imleria badia]|nr:hypothetical protein OG21DRAFT_1409850 [Imleria badia]